MKIILLTIGKTADRLLSEAIDRYTARIPHYVPFEYRVLPDAKGARGDAERQKLLEGQAILAQLQPGDSLILMDERGKEMTSRQFAEYLGRVTVTQQRNIVFVIGGPYGFSQAVYDRANSMMSLSKMTLTHEMARLFCAEQIYRAFTILRGEPYHHD